MKVIEDMIMNHPNFLEKINANYLLKDDKVTYTIIIRKPIIQEFGLSWSSSFHNRRIDEAADWFQTLWLNINKIWLEAYKVKWLLSPKEEVSYREMFIRIAHTQRMLKKEKMKVLDKTLYEIDNNVFIDHLKKVMDDYQIPVEVNNNQIKLKLEKR